MVAFGAGFLLGNFDPGSDSLYHDLRVNQVEDYTGLVVPAHRSVHSLAERLGSYEKAYYFVRDRIRLESTAPAAHPDVILAGGRASCLGKATLLCSLYRSLGLPAENVRVVTGKVTVPGRVIDHAWVDLEYQGTCLQQDPSGLLGVFDFAAFPGSEYVKAFVREEGYCFNDAGFAVVSQLNRFKDTFPENTYPTP